MHRLLLLVVVLLRHSIAVGIRILLLRRRLRDESLLRCGAVRRLVVHLGVDVVNGWLEDWRLGDQEQDDPGKGLEDVDDELKGLKNVFAKVILGEVGADFDDDEENPEEH